MSYWLFEQVLKEDDDRTPQWALQSTINWMKALSYEINCEYGAEPSLQFDSCRKVLLRRGTARVSSMPLALIYEPLFHSLTFCSTLISLHQSGNTPPWSYQSAVITWYYSYYNAFKCMLAANNQQASDTHSSVIKTINSGLRNNLPHPFNMVAKRIQGEKYQSFLPDYPDEKSFDLVKLFPETRDASRGMILQYLSGTADYEAWKTKKKILSNKSTEFTDFRTKKAREQRDKQLQTEINFMHCAFRYRGKANYRDAIYITYGKRELPSNTFIADLANTARFAFICALAFTEKHMGALQVQYFLEDLQRNFRGTKGAKAEEVFWMNFA